MEPFIGQIQTFGFNFPPRGWGDCTQAAWKPKFLNNVGGRAGLWPMGQVGSHSSPCKIRYKAPSSIVVPAN